jgi:hypothetical protein
VCQAQRRRTGATTCSASVRLRGLDAPYTLAVAASLANRSARMGHIAAMGRRSRLAETFASDDPELAQEFHVFAADMAYGHDSDRTAIDFTAGKPMSGRHERVTVAADRGWQNNGLKLDAGKTY